MKRLMLVVLLGALALSLGAQGWDVYWNAYSLAEKIAVLVGYTHGSIKWWL
jgi:hypothetical protein